MKFRTQQCTSSRSNCLCPPPPPITLYSLNDWMALRLGVLGGAALKSVTSDFSVIRVHRDRAFLWVVREPLPDYTAPHPRRQIFTDSPVKRNSYRTQKNSYLGTDLGISVRCEMWSSTELRLQNCLQISECSTRLNDTVQTSWICQPEFVSYSKFEINIQFKCVVFRRAGKIAKSEY
jgi:hypothetical protein